MHSHSDTWALVKQQHDECIKILREKPWQIEPLSSAQKEILRKNLFSIFNVLSKADRSQAQSIEDNEIEAKLPPWEHEFRIDILESNIPDLKKVFEDLDPVGYDLCCTLFDGLPKTRIKYFLIDSLNNVYEDVNTGELSTKGFFYKKYTDKVFKGLIYCFEPDDWLIRAEKIQPVRTAFKNKSRNIPKATHVRIQEANSCFVHGHWLAVQILCRSIMESIIKECAGKLNIDLKPAGSSRDKRLNTLISETSQVLPGLEIDMREIKDSGDKAVHPNPKISGLNSDNEARALRSIELLPKVCEAIYAYAK